jgi:hypothetical protein
MTTRAMYKQRGQKRPAYEVLPSLRELGANIYEGWTTPLCVGERRIHLRGRAPPVEQWLRDALIRGAPFALASQAAR